MAPNPPGNMARIYISSTYSDLAAARESVYRALRRAGHEAIAMEDYVAADQRPLERCLADVASCDAYVGIFAWRYGYVPPGESRSITELEFREARRQGIPTLLFLLHEDAPWPRSAIDRDEEPIERLREELSRDFLVSFFHTPDELSALVMASLSNLQRSTPRPRAPATDFLRTPVLGIEVWQEGSRNPLLRASGAIRVPMRQAPFEIRIPDVANEDHVKIASSWTTDIFDFTLPAAYADVPWFMPGTGMADHGYGSGELWVQDEAHMYLNPGGRLMSFEGGGLVLFHSIGEPGSASLPRAGNVYLLVHVARPGTDTVTLLNTERLILSFDG